MTNVIFCSGKHYYALDKYRTTNNIKNTAIVRIEVDMKTLSFFVVLYTPDYPNPAYPNPANPNVREIVNAHAEFVA